MFEIAIVISGGDANLLQARYCHAKQRRAHPGAPLPLDLNRSPTLKSERGGYGRVRAPPWRAGALPRPAGNRGCG